jgi:protease-4
MNIGHALQSMLRINTGHGRQAGPELEESVLEDNNSLNKIAVLNINGIITGDRIDGTETTLVELIKAQLKKAQEDEKVKAVVLKMDSPGGEVLASDEISKAIGDFQDATNNGKPVIISMGSLAASGGYYISCQGRWIVANELTITGSIGVIMETFNYRGLMDKVGLMPMVFKSGAHKDMLSGAREPAEIPDDEKQMVQSLINEAYEKFKSVVEDGRNYASDMNKTNGNPLVENWKDFADGRVLTGKQAYDLGLVDQLGDFDDAVDKAIEIAGIKNANLVEYNERRDLSDLFRMFGETKAHGVKVDIGLNMPKLQAGRMYFLAPTYQY